MGFEGLFRSQMKISDSLAPEAIKLDWKGLTSRARTGPTCWLDWLRTGSEAPLKGLIIN